MAKIFSLWISFLLFLLFASLSGKTNAADEERKIYIVYMGAVPDEKYSLSEQHASILEEVINESFSEQYLIRSYTKSFNAFAANLTKQQYQKLTANKEVVSIFPSRTLQLLTTESWDFIGFPVNVSRNLKMESDVIIGVIDTGIWPESESFSDHGLGPVPEKWKGPCDGGKNFKCNRKIIGARHYDIEDSARDIVGHGTHTASTAAGNLVPNTSFYGIAAGIARGGVPSARIAVYKVCLPSGCSEHDIMAAFDDAVADGVDILTVSLGANYPIAFQYDAMSIASFHAAKNGILTVNAAGNNGFGPRLTSSIVPWLFSVAASSTKRRITSKVSIGNGKELTGLAVNTFKMNGTNFPLIYGNDSSEDCDEVSARSCLPNCLDKNKVKGKIVLCDRSKGIGEASGAGAIGAISTAGVSDVSFVVPFPASVIDLLEFEELLKYYESAKTPGGSIFPSESTENSFAPMMASFSSRGPNMFLPDILKPDITAPGLNILAAFSPVGHPSSMDTDERSVKYNIVSGTSMACPHVAGAAAYVKSFNPNWSASAIKSALMTTARKMDTSNTVYKDDEFSFGAGHIDPIKALNPGLVYETLNEDYVEFLCSMDFDNSTLRRIFGDNTTCTQKYESEAKDLNYPSMAAAVNKGKDWVAKFRRTVTNVGKANSTYKATVTTNVLDVTVEPNILTFQALSERKSFNVTVKIGKGLSIWFANAYLEWSDGVHYVRSPIVVYAAHG